MNFLFHRQLWAYQNIESAFKFLLGHTSKIIWVYFVSDLSYRDLLLKFLFYFFLLIEAVLNLLHLPVGVRLDQWFALVLLQTTLFYLEVNFGFVAFVDRIVNRDKVALHFICIFIILSKLFFVSLLLACTRLGGHTNLSSIAASEHSLASTSFLALPTCTKQTIFPPWSFQWVSANKSPKSREAQVRVPTKSPTSKGPRFYWVLCPFNLKSLEFERAQIEFTCRGDITHMCLSLGPDFAKLTKW